MGFIVTIFVSFKDFTQKDMFVLVNSFWVSLWTCIFHVFSFISYYFFRFSGEKTVETRHDFDDVCEEVADESIEETTDEKKGHDRIIENEISMGDTDVGSVYNVGTSKYEFYGGNSVCAFIEEPQIINFTVHEMFVMKNDVVSSTKHDLVPKIGSIIENSFSGFPVDVKDESISHDVALFGESNLLEQTVCDELSGEIEIDDRGDTEDSVCYPISEVVDDQEKAESFVFSLSSDEQEVSSISQDELSEKDEIVDKTEVSDQIQSSLAKSDDFWASIHRYDCYIGSNDEFDYDSDEISCYKVSGDAFVPKTPLGISGQRVDFDGDYSPSSLGETSFGGNNCQLDDSSVESDQNEADNSPYIELELNEVYNNSTVHNEEHVFKGVSFAFDHEIIEIDQKSSGFDHKLKGIDASESSGEGDNHQMGEVDVLLEQRELIRQMKKEMRQLKINGLPTILEESESPRVEDDLRPLKIDERIGHKDRMDEIQTFYKRYLDQMRKLDILSQQTMYAIGLLQLKHQDQLALNKKVSVPAIKSLLAQNFWSHKLRKHETDTVQKLIKDLRSELELVYVGQLCLSWEILKWQHHKLEDLKAHDPDGFRQYNQVAGDFQKFQVLLQRFTEDEPYHQGPRVQHYLKSRCGHPNLLQIPLIKEDPKSEWRGDGEGAISLGALKELIAASMRAFWDFLHADKDEVHVTTLMGLHGVHVELQDSSDSELLAEIRSNLQKKEKRLKDLVRSGNCIVRKFQKHQDQRLSHEMFLAQVELRLVSRVLNMSKLTTDQLLWCHKKINRINIISRKVYIESSFLLFPS